MKEAIIEIAEQHPHRRAVTRSQSAANSKLICNTGVRRAKTYSAKKLKKEKNCIRRSERLLRAKCQKDI